LLAGLGHQLLEALAGLGPGFVAQRHFATALALALVLPRMFAAAALPLAVIHAVAVVRGHGGAVGLAGALVGCALLAFVLARGNAATGVRSLEQPWRRGGLLVLLVLVRRRRRLAAVAADQGTRGQSAQSGKCQAAQVAPIESLIVHGSPREEKVFVSWLIETGGGGDGRPPFASFPPAPRDRGFRLSPSPAGMTSTRHR